MRSRVRPIEIVVVEILHVLVSVASALRFEHSIVVSQVLLVMMAWRVLSVGVSEEPIGFFVVLAETKRTR